MHGQYAGWLCKTCVITDRLSVACMSTLVLCLLAHHRACAHPLLHRTCLSMCTAGSKRRAAAMQHRCVMIIM
jgi:hypothetical protein